MANRQATMLADLDGLAHFLEEQARCQLFSAETCAAIRGTLGQLQRCNVNLIRSERDVALFIRHCLYTLRTLSIWAHTIPLFQTEMRSVAVAQTPFPHQLQRWRYAICKFLFRITQVQETLQSGNHDLS